LTQILINPPDSLSSKQQTEVFDQPESPISVPPFANDVKLTVGELFAWLLE